MYCEWFHGPYLKNATYKMYKVNYNSRTSYVNSYYSTEMAFV